MPKDKKSIREKARARAKRLEIATKRDEYPITGNRSLQLDEQRPMRSKSDVVRMEKEDAVKDKDAGPWETWLLDRGNSRKDPRVRQQRKYKSQRDAQDRRAELRDRKKDR